MNSVEFEAVSIYLAYSLNVSDITEKPSSLEKTNITFQFQVLVASSFVS